MRPNSRMGQARRRVNRIARTYGSMAARPSGGYNPMKKEGAIILGIVRDNSNAAVGTFFEGCMTAGYPSDAVEDAVKANIVAVGYGHWARSIC